MARDEYSEQRDKLNQSKKSNIQEKRALEREEKTFVGKEIVKDIIEENSQYKYERYKEI